MITKEEFNNLEVLEQINYINDNIGLISLNKFCQRLGIGRTTISDRATKIGYKYNKDLRRFIKIDEEEQKEVNQKPLKANLKPSKDDININTLLKRIELLEDRVNILENKATEQNKLYEVNPINNNIRFYKQHNDTTYTVRVNIEVFNKFKEFTKKYSQYKQRDLISSALSMYMELFEDDK